jgi:hypothetical protein
MQVNIVRPWHAWQSGRSIGVSISSRRISFGRVMLLRIGECMVRPADGGRLSGYQKTSMARFAASHCSILLAFGPVKPGSLTEQYCSAKHRKRH